MSQGIWAAKCVWSSRHGSGRKIKTWGCLLPEESIKKEIQAKTRKECAATGAKKEPPFLGCAPEHWSPTADPELNSRGPVPTARCVSRGTPRSQTAPHQPLPKPTANPLGTRTVFVTFQPQSVRLFTKHPHSRIEGKEG